MRIRTIKPEFWTSEDIAALDMATRLLFIGLWSYVDDNGVGVDRPTLIAAALFPEDLSRDSRDTLATLSRGLQALSEAGLITRYTCDGGRYLEITSWKRHQKIDRPSKGRYPHYSAENCEPSRDTRETLATGTGEQGNRGTEEQGKMFPDGNISSAISDELEIAPEPEPVRDDVERVCQHMAKSIQERGGKKPVISKAWRDSARLMLDKDQIAEKDIHAAIDWSANDSFWRSNILSVPKLREKYLQLSLQAQRQPGPSSRRLGLVQPTTDEQTQEIVNAIYTPPLLKEILAHEAAEQAEKEATA